jgi:hypothetical protein
VIAGALLSPKPCDVLQNAHGNLSNVKRPISSLVHSSSSEHPSIYSEPVVSASFPVPRTFPENHNTGYASRTNLHRSLTLHVTDTAKVVARKTGASPKTVDSHRQGNVPQSWAQMIAYGRAYPGFALDVVELMGVDIGQDREAYALFLQLQRQVRGQ